MTSRRRCSPPVPSSLKTVRHLLEISAYKGVAQYTQPPLPVHTRGHEVGSSLRGSGLQYAGGCLTGPGAAVQVSLCIPCHCTIFLEVICDQQSRSRPAVVHLRACIHVISTLGKEPGCRFPSNADMGHPDPVEGRDPSWSSPSHLAECNHHGCGTYKLNTCIKEQDTPYYLNYEGVMMIRFQWLQ